MRLSEIVVIYFVIGSVMVGGGALDFSEAGIATEFVDQESDGFSFNSSISQEIADTGGAIDTVVTLTVGGISLIWDLMKILFGFIHWPIVALSSNNAPPMAVLLLGGSMTAAFYMAIGGLVWRAT